MAVELQKLADAETLHVSSFCESAPASALKRLVSEARLETRIHSLTLVLERLWLFYEAMRSGKPLPGGDELLAQMVSALKDATRTKHSSQGEEFTSEAKAFISQQDACARAKSISSGWRGSKIAP